MDAVRYRRKERGGPRGRALVVDLPSVQLLKGDRLEPDETLQDVAAFYSAITPFAHDMV